MVARTISQKAIGEVHALVRNTSQQCMLSSVISNVIYEVKRVIIKAKQLITKPNIRIIIFPYINKRGRRTF